MIFWFEDYKFLEWYCVQLYVCWNISEALFYNICCFNIFLFNLNTFLRWLDCGPVYRGVSSVYWNSLTLALFVSLLICRSGTFYVISCTHVCINVQFWTSVITSQKHFPWYIKNKNWETSKQNWLKYSRKLTCDKNP